jgi:hypothetical protein
MYHSLVQLNCAEVTHYQVAISIVDLVIQSVSQSVTEERKKESAL